MAERDEDAGLSPSKVSREYVVVHRKSLKHLLGLIIRGMTPCDKRGCKVPAMWRTGKGDKYANDVAFWCDAHVPGEANQIPQSEGARIGIEMLKALER